MEWGAPQNFQPFLQFAAFWCSVMLFSGPRPVRFLWGLVLGAGCARLGWAVFHTSAWLTSPWSVVDATGGFTILAVPLGPLLLTPGGVSTRPGLAYRAAVARALTPAFALSRLGCWMVGCCGGKPISEVASHPVALYEIVGWLLLAAGLRRVPVSWVPGVWLMAFGGLRLLLEPLRAVPPLGEPEVEAVWIAGAWMLLGAATWRVDARSPDPSRRTSL